MLRIIGYKFGKNNAGIIGCLLVLIKGTTQLCRTSKLSINAMFTSIIKELLETKKLNVMKYRQTLIVTGFGKTDHIVTIDISRNTDLKHRSHHGSLVLGCSHARFAV